MAVFKCKMCGGDLVFEQGSTVCECEYCGSRQTLPNDDSEKKTNLFNRANRLRRNNEFDKASSVYESIVAEFPEEAEGYWGLCLCRYGIEYVDDPLTGKKMPTCHRTLTSSIMDDSNFDQACENADMTARVLYRDEAKEIDRLQKEILAIAVKEAPYDVFICYKETSDIGERTEDSVLAQEIFDALTAKNYKVFFSRITLEDKLGEQYEPYIYAALSSSKIMLAVGTKFEYYDAVWVKNEWSRFLHMMQSDRTKKLIPCFKNLDAYDIPKEFKGLQAQDMGKLGWLQDLVRGVEKILGGNQSTKPAKAVPAETHANATVDSLLKRVFMFLEDKNWKEADAYCERVLDIDPECAEAYLGKLMAYLKVDKRKHLSDYGGLFEDNGNYKKAVRYGNDALKKELSDCILAIKYRQAKSDMEEADSEREFKSVAKQFEKIEKYKDSAKLAEECRKKAEACRAKAEEERKRKEAEAEEERKREEAEKEQLKKQLKKDKAEALVLAEYIEKVEEADKKKKTIENQIKSLIDELTNISKLKEKEDSLNSEIAEIEKKIISLSHKKDSLGIFAIKEKKNIELQIETLKKKKNETKGILAECEEKLFSGKSKEEIDNSIAVMQSQIGKLEIAFPENTAVSSYAEAKARIENLCSNKEVYKAIHLKITKIKPLKVGDVICFGSYEQDNDTSNGKEEIEWQILEIQDNKILLISKYALDCQKYNSENTDVTWETCTLRKWLNSTFISNAFSESEKSMIADTKVTADKNPKYSTNPGNDTTDKIFLLSINEVNKYFTTGESRKCVPTAYAIEQGAYTSGSNTSGGKATCWWWLRSPGCSRFYASDVYTDGSVYFYGTYVYYSVGCVRPALWINL